MTKRILIFLLACLLALSGCGSDSSFESGPLTGSSTATPVTTRTTVDAETGGTAATGEGQAVIFPAGSLAQDTEVTLSLLAAPPFEPRDPDFDAVGKYLQVDLGGIGTLAPVTLEIPYPSDDAPNAYIQLASEDGLYVPLLTDYDTAKGVLTTTVDLAAVAALVPARSEVRAQFNPTRFIVGAADSDDFADRPAHTNWPSWNAYRLDDEGFVQVVNQGTVVGSLSNLGDRPLVIVHGLGSSIGGDRFTPLAQYLEDSLDYTSVLGFEYDTAAPIELTGPMLAEFYQMVDSLAPGAEWNHLAHSMGCLVSREAFENHGPLPYDSNKAVFVAGPHLGSPVASALVSGSAKTFNTGLQMLISNDFLDFSNADGTPCRPTQREPGFVDLTTNSDFLVALNPDADTRHSKETYRTIAGTEKGPFALLSFVLSINVPEDGLVPLESANADFIGSVESAEVEDNHIELLDIGKNGPPQILQFLNR